VNVGWLAVIYHGIDAKAVARKLTPHETCRLKTVGFKAGEAVEKFQIGIRKGPSAAYFP